MLILDQPGYVHQLKVYYVEYTVDQIMSVGHTLSLESQVYPTPLHLCGQCLAVPRCPTCLSVTTLIATTNEMLTSLWGHLGVNHPVAGAISTRLTYFLPVPLAAWKVKAESTDKRSLTRNACVRFTNTPTVHAHRC